MMSLISTPEAPPVASPGLVHVTYRPLRSRGLWGRTARHTLGFNRETRSVVVRLPGVSGMLPVPFYVLGHTGMVVRVLDVGVIDRQDGFPGKRAKPVDFCVKSQNLPN